MNDKVSLKDGTLKELTEGLEAVWTSKPDVVKGVDKFLKKHNHDASIPRPKKERIQLLWDTARKLR